jgi:hypothetical protein
MNLALKTYFLLMIFAVATPVVAVMASREMPALLMSTSTSPTSFSTLTTPCSQAT